MPDTGCRCERVCAFFEDGGWREGECCWSVWVSGWVRWVAVWGRGAWGRWKETELGICERGKGREGEEGRIAMESGQSWTLVVVAKCEMKGIGKERPMI